MQEKQGIIGLFVVLGFLGLLIGTYTKLLSFSDGLFFLLAFWLAAGGSAKFFSTDNESEEIYASGTGHKIFALVVSALLISLVGASLLFGQWPPYSFAFIAFALILYWIFSGIITTFTRKTAPEHYDSFV